MIKTLKKKKNLGGYSYCIDEDQAEFYGNPNDSSKNMRLTLKFSECDEKSPTTKLAPG